MSNLQWAVQTIKEFMERLDKQIHEDPERFRQAVLEAEDMDPATKSRLLEYINYVEIKATLK